MCIGTVSRTNIEYQVNRTQRADMSRLPKQYTRNNVAGMCSSPGQLAALWQLVISSPVIFGPGMRAPGAQVVSLPTLGKTLR